MGPIIYFFGSYQVDDRDDIKVEMDDAPASQFARSCHVRITDWEPSRWIQESPVALFRFPSPSTPYRGREIQAVPKP